MKQLQRKFRRSILSALLASAAFVALMLPIVTPGLDPALVGSHAFHGHVAIDGVVEPHSHDPGDQSSNEIVFTTDDSGSAGGGLVLLSPTSESFAMPSTSLRIDLPANNFADQWSPRSPVRPPQFSV